MNLVDILCNTLHQFVVALVHVGVTKDEIVVLINDVVHRLVVVGQDLPSLDEAIQPEEELCHKQRAPLVDRHTGD